MASYHNFITSDHRVMLGKPTVRGTRLTVELLLRKLAEGATAKELTVMYPQLLPEHIQAVLEYAAAVIVREEIINSAA